jgi:hypothetical protein
MWDVGKWGTMIWDVRAVPALSFWAALLLGAALGIIGISFLKGMRPRAIGLAALAVALFIPIAVRANPVESSSTPQSAGTNPLPLVAGTLARAEDVNNLIAAATIVSANGMTGPFATAGATLFCGVAPTVPNGSFTFNSLSGFPAALAMCQALSGCKNVNNAGTVQTAHMCSAEEISRSAQLGILPLSTTNGAWYSTGAVSFTPTGIAIDDCSSTVFFFGGQWTNSTAGAGAVWGSTSTNVTQIGWDQCSQPHEVMCCN